MNNEPNPSRLYSIKPCSIKTYVKSCYLGSIFSAGSYISLIGNYYLLCTHVHTVNWFMNIYTVNWFCVHMSEDIFNSDIFNSKWQIIILLSSFIKYLTWAASENSSKCLLSLKLYTFLFLNTFVAEIIRTP